MTLAYNRIAYELDSINIAPDDVEGLSLVHHFDYPESIAYTGNTSVVQSGQKLGKGCAYFPDRDSKVTISNNTGMFNLNSLGNYEFEFFAKFNNITADLEAQGYKFFGGHTFKYFNTPLTWDNAKAACEALGGHLATSISSEKNTFLSTLTTDIAWLGGTNEETEGVWKWVTGEAWNYTNWGEGQPDSGDAERRLEMNFSSSDLGKWNDDNATATQNYLCEWDYDMRISNILSIGDLDLTEEPVLVEVTKLDLTRTAELEAQGYKFFGGHTFKYFNTPLTWHNAKAACEALGGHLATSTSSEKNTFLTTLTTDLAWLGGTDEETEGVWKWVTGEAWNYTNWYTRPDNYQGIQHYLATNFIIIGKWDDYNETLIDYICEWDYDMREYQGYNSSVCSLSLTSNTFHIDKTSQIKLEYDTWYHILLRISNENISVFLNGERIMNSYIPVAATIEPEQVALGGYIGYMDEFAFRRNAGTEAPEIPEYPYDSVIITEGSSTERESTAPVTRAVWSAENLPEGLNLSENGILTGHPTTIGTYEVPFTISTNWGMTTKILRIVVE